MARKTFFLDQGELLGGAERFLIDFLGQLQRSECRRIYPILLGDPCEDYLKILHEQAPLVEMFDFHVPSVRGGFVRKGLVILKLLKAARKLKALCKKHEVDQVFTNTPRTHFVMLLARKLGLKCRWVVMLHDFTTPPHIMRQIASWADILIANSLPTRAWLHDAIAPGDQPKIRIVENGVDLSQIPEGTHPPLEVNTVTILGRIDPRKGQQHAVEAADLLHERNRDLEFQIVGSPAESDPRTMEYDQQIRSFVADRSLDNVTFCPEVPNAFVAFSGADIVLALPTEPETFGRIVIEAMAMGRMVLTWDQTGPREIIQSYIQWVWRNHDLKLEKSAFIIEDKNTMSLAETIGYYGDHPDALEPLTRYMSDFVVENFSLEETKKRLLTILAE